MYVKSHMLVLTADTVLKKAVLVLNLGSSVPHTRIRCGHQGPTLLGSHWLGLLWLPGEAAFPSWPGKAPPEGGVSPLLTGRLCVSSCSSQPHSLALKHLAP